MLESKFFVKGLGSIAFRAYYFVKNKNIFFHEKNILQYIFIEKKLI
jgi:hypothetical protein